MNGFLRYNALQRIDNCIRRLVTTSHRRSVHGRGTKHVGYGKPSGWSTGYEETYVAAIVARDRVRVKMCLHKNRYASLSEACLVMGVRETKSGKQLRSYYCPYCSGYHLTSQPLAPLPAAA